MSNVTAIGDYRHWGYQCTSCLTWVHGAYHTCVPWTMAGTTARFVKEEDVAKQHMTVRLPGDLVDSVEIMAEHRKEDKTTLLTKMLRFALAQKQAGCEHEEMKDRVCVTCGLHFPEPSDDF